MIGLDLWSNCEGGEVNFHLQFSGVKAKWGVVSWVFPESDLGVTLLLPGSVDSGKLLDRLDLFFVLGYILPSGLLRVEAGSVEAQLPWNGAILKSRVLASGFAQRLPEKDAGRPHCHHHHQRWQQ